MKSTPLHSASKDDDDRPHERNSIHHAVVIHHEHNRRVILATLLTTSASTLYPSVSCALNDADDEFDNMNTLTRQIRRSVVRGAQLIDTVDGAWERFSDDFGLGSKRNLPKRNVIDAGGNAVTKKFVTSSKLPLSFFDETFALGILRLCDEAFLQCLTYQQPQQTMNKVELNEQIDQLKQYLRKSFFSSSNDNHAPPSREEKYNFDCYIHFRVYNEILIKQNVIFPPFFKAFEQMIGTSILQFAIQQQQYHSGVASSSLAQSLNNALSVTDNIATLLQTKGLITSWERSIPLDDTMEDFVDDNNEDSAIISNTMDLTYSLALNGDITLNSQLLLQELGYRLYPSFGRWMVNEAIFQCFMSHLPTVASLSINGNNRYEGYNNNNSSSSTAKIIVNIDDYYMDTSYNSNPDLFEVKQILLNIVIQRD
jgi:hypothetical protein